MSNQEQNNQINAESQFLSGDLTEAYLTETELDSVVGGASFAAAGRGVAKSETILGCWEDCTQRISGCKKITT
ncbi:MAG: hypothetical protein ACFCU9_11335 [Cyanophyceae cyanobacterium]